MNKACPECGSERVVVSMGEISCRKCGLVISDNILISA
jgi:transcription initiation factor TFIIIB Brf1 subunit/transcription initiation factor TFIIB